MTHGFQQQNRTLGFQVPRSAAMPQHGQKADPRAVQPPEPRSFQPRPGH